MAIITVPSTPISGGTFDFSSKEENFVATQISPTKFVIANRQRNPDRTLSRVVQINTDGSVNFYNNWAVNKTPGSSLCLRTISSSKVLLANIRNSSSQNDIYFQILNIDENTNEIQANPPVALSGSSSVNSLGVTLYNPNRDYGLYFFRRSSTNEVRAIKIKIIGNSVQIFGGYNSGGKVTNDYQTNRFNFQDICNSDTLFFVRNDAIIRCSVASNWFNDTTNAVTINTTFIDPSSTFTQTYFNENNPQKGIGFVLGRINNNVLYTYTVGNSVYRYVVFETFVGNNNYLYYANNSIFNSHQNSAFRVGTFLTKDTLCLATKLPAGKTTLVEGEFFNNIYLDIFRFHEDNYGGLILLKSILCFNGYWIPNLSHTKGTNNISPIFNKDVFFNGKNIIYFFKRYSPKSYCIIVL